MASSKVVRNAGAKAPPAARRKSPKPPNAGKGRVKGVPNKITGILKEAIIFAAEARGSNGKGKDGLTGYCFHLAAKHPKAFSTLLGRVLPLQVALEGKLNLSPSVTLNVKSKPG